MTTATANVTHAQLSAALQTMIAVTEAIRDAGRIPEGTLYAFLMGRMDQSGFDAMVRQIVGTGLVRQERGELVWVG